MEPEVKDHAERDVKTVCGYCGKAFQEGENVIEKTINGREWRFCSPDCLHEFKDALDFLDPEED